MSRLPARVLAAARVADDEDGRRRPVKDVVAPGRFLLIAGDGAIVVRPDRFIAWRSPAAASDPRAVLTAALSQTLGRRPFAQPGSAGS
jgi:hypothetical protein